MSQNPNKFFLREMLEFVFRPIAKVAAIPVLGIGMGIPIQIFGVTAAANWDRDF